MVAQTLRIQPEVGFLVGFALDAQGCKLGPNLREEPVIGLVELAFVQTKWKESQVGLLVVLVKLAGMLHQGLAEGQLQIAKNYELPLVALKHVARQRDLAVGMIAVGSSRSDLDH